MCVLALLGSLLWVVRWIVADPGTQTATVLEWGGLAAMLGALALLGMRLVSGDAAALQVVVGTATPLLAWAVHDLVAPSGHWFDGVLGVLVGVVALVPLVKGQPESGDPAPAVPAPRSGDAVDRSTLGERRGRQHAR